MEEVGDIALVILDELFLAPAGVNDKADAEVELIGVGEEADRLGDAVLDNGEVFLGKVVDEAAGGVVDAHRGVDQMSLHFQGREVLSKGAEWQKEGRC